MHCRESAASMAMSQTLMNRKKKMVLFLQSVGQLQGLKATIETGALKREGNANNRSLEQLRTLCRQGRLKEALNILFIMNHRVDSPTYACLFQECINKKALSEGKLVHAHMIGKGFMPDRFLGNTLVNLYAKCGSLEAARRVFDKMSERDVASWTVMIATYAKHGPADEALALFHQMQRTGIQANHFTFASVLPACANLACLEQGKEIHGEIIRSGIQHDVFVENALVDMYAKCGNIDCARNVFDKMPQRDLVSWNAMTAGFAQNGHIEEAQELFWKMSNRDVVSWTAMIAGYAQNGHVDEALKLFQAMPERNVVSWNAMITTYALNGYVDKALKLFQKMPERNVSSWNAMITVYAQNGYGMEALMLFQEMQLAGVKPNSRTFATVLPTCADLEALEHGMKIHDEIISTGLQSDVIVGNALVDMYAKCGNIDKAHNVFDKMPLQTMVSWNVLIAGYAHNGHVDEALKLFQKMPKQNMVSWNAMIAGYVQNGQVEEALDFFQKMPERNVISWSTMIAGYAQNGYHEEALLLFKQMYLAGVKPNSRTFASVVPACANLESLEQGMEIHEEIIRSGFQSDLFVGNALVDMYAKCGSIENAHALFNKLPERNVVSWNVMIAGYAMHGYGREALRLFELMRHSGTDPDDVTFIGVLSACCHAGLVEEGWQYFDCMSQYNHITRAMEHYGCMVDLLGRAGCLYEAQEFINKMQIKPDATVWRCLLGACRIHNNMKIGEHVAEHLLELDPKNPAPYVLLSNIYAAAGRWDDIAKVRKIMKDRRVKKKPGCSWIEIKKHVYAFLSGDRSHPQMKKTYA